MGSVVKKIKSYRLQPNNTEDAEFLVTTKMTTSTVVTKKHTVDDRGNLISPREEASSEANTIILEEIVSAIGLQSKSEAKVVDVVYTDGTTPDGNLAIAEIEQPVERRAPINLTNLYNNDSNGRPKPINLTGF